MIKIITLIDNVTYKEGLKGEHGLSFLVKTPDIKILFDTGQSDQFIKNATLLGEDLTDVDYLVISHGHYDHTGGIQAFLELNNKAKIIINENAFEDKFSKSTGVIRPIGMSVAKDSIKRRVQLVTDSLELNTGIWVLGNIINQTTYETVNPKLLVSRESNLVSDTFEDELVLYLIHHHQLIIISGCAHHGIINTINAVEKHSGIDSIRLITGGTHLNGAPNHRIEATVNDLKKMKIDSLMPNHCTGIAAYQYLSEHLDFHVAYSSTGTMVTV